jgi:hypothetical protein
MQCHQYSNIGQEVSLPVTLDQNSINSIVELVAIIQENDTELKLNINHALEAACQSRRPDASTISNGDGKLRNGVLPLMPQRLQWRGFKHIWRQLRRP